MIVSLPKKPDLVVVENFVENALRLWRLQLVAEGTDVACGSDAVFAAVAALIYLFEATSLPHYLYQAAVLTRYSLSLDRQQYCRNLALLSTRLHLKLGLGTIAFEHYGRVQVKEMLHDNVAWILLSRISQSHPFGASGPRGFSTDDELKKVISTLSRMEKKVDDLLYADLKQFMYDMAFDLLDLKRKLRTSLTKQFCIIERRRIARLAGAPVDMALELPFRGKHAILSDLFVLRSNRSTDLEDTSDNCHWNAVPELNRAASVGLKKTQLIMPITKLWVHNFRTLIDVVNGIVLKEFPAGHVSKLNEWGDGTSADRACHIRCFLPMRLYRQHWLRMMP
jgi:N-terminal acetyltransferase B complex non-catalytic subunit